MSDLADLLADVAKDLPANVRAVVDTAIAEGWELNKPGMTLCLRLNHPTDELAQPVYISWKVARTAKGNLSITFNSCGTQGLFPLTGADLLEYLKDPTVIYPVDEPEPTVEEMEDTPRWDDRATAQANLCASLGASEIEDRKAPKPLKFADAKPFGPLAGQSSGASAPPLRV